MSQSVEFRVQYIDDVDPFNVLASIKHAEPTLPKRFSFVSEVPLYDQVPGMKKTLRSPHKVRTHSTPPKRPETCPGLARERLFLAARYSQASVKRGGELLLFCGGTSIHALTQIHAHEHWCALCIQVVAS